jgi:hypothetical protein
MAMTAAQTNGWMITATTISSEQIVISLIVSLISGLIHIWIGTYLIFLICLTTTRVCLCTT